MFAVLIRKAEVNSLDFVVNRFCMKLFRTNSMNTIKDCQAYFHLNLPSELLVKRNDKFLSKLSAINNIYCRSLA